MLNSITQEELIQLPTVMLTEFNIDCSDIAYFVVSNGSKITEICANFADNKRVYYLADLNSIQRIIAMQAMDLIIEQMLGENSIFQQDELQTIVYFALHSMCMNYGLYTSKGRNLLSFEESTSC